MDRKQGKNREGRPSGGIVLDQRNMVIIAAIQGVDEPENHLVNNSKKGLPFRPNKLEKKQGIYNTNN